MSQAEVAVLGVSFELIAWLEDRVFPSDRVGVKDLLRTLNLKKYDFLDIAVKTRDCLIEDGYWIEVEDSDTFRENTVRGQYGFPDLNIEDYRNLVSWAYDH